MKKASTTLQAVSQKELKRRDFIINGSLWKVVFSIAAPLFFFSIFQYIYSIIDTIMCTGISKSAVNAVGALSQANNMISAIGNGLSAGGSILIAREIGKNNYKRAQGLSTTIFFYTFVLGLLTCAIILPLTEPLLRMIGITETSIAVGRGYFMISVVNSAVLMVNTVFMGIEKAKGSTVMITGLNVIVVLLKIGLNALFLYAFDLKDMTYVSLATLIANLCLMIFVLIYIGNKNYIFRFRFKNIDFSFKTLSKTTKISFPIFLGKFIFSLGKVVINALAGSYGDDVVGALGVSNNMGGSVTNPISSIEDSTSSIISQNIGAKKIDRSLKCFLVGMVYALAIAVVGVVIVSVFNDPITLFFARNSGTEEEVQAFAKEISSVFYYEKMGIITLAVNSAVLGLLYGFGYTTIASIINIARVFVFRIPSFLVCKYGLKMTDGFKCAGISMGFSNIAIGITALIVAIVIIVKIKKKMKIKEASQMLTADETKEVNAFIDSYLMNFKPYKAGTWCYEDGVVLNGAFKLYKETGLKKYLDFCTDYFDKQIKEDGSLPGYDPKNANLDDLEPGYALFQVNKVAPKEKYQKAIDLMASQLKSEPRLNNGSFIHKSRYPGQLWLDGLFMASPFYAFVATSHHTVKEVHDIDMQFENVDLYNYDPLTRQYYHCYDEKKVMQWADKKSGRSPNVWLRSLGWLIMADADVAGVFKDNQFSSHMPIYKKQLRQALLSIEPYEDSKTHLYKDLPLIDSKKNYFETSGSLMVAYGYLKGSRIGMLDYSMAKHGGLIFESVVKNHLKDGHLTNICLVSGLDNERRNGTVDYYLSEPVVMDDAKGVGPFMMAYAEYLSLPY